MSPDGKMLAYCNGSEFHMASADGSNDGKVATMPSPNFVENPVWSPDGQHLRFDADDRIGQSSSIWAISKDGTGIHRLFAGGDKPARCLLWRVVQRSEVLPFPVKGPDLGPASKRWSVSVRNKTNPANIQSTQVGKLPSSALMGKDSLSSVGLTAVN